MRKSRFQFYIILFAIATVPVFADVSLGNLFLGLNLENKPLHSTIEAMGVLAAIFMASILLLKQNDETRGKVFLLALGFLGMGILDTFHAISKPGDGFVLLHSLASLIGGFCFVLTCFPFFVEYFSKKTSLSWIVISGSLLCGTWIFLLPDTFPAMIHNGEFTTAARVINILSGMMFLVAAFRFMLDFYYFDTTEAYLLACMSLLFGVAEISFYQSSIWNSGWWLWHLLRLIAYFVVLLFIIRQYIMVLAKQKESEEKYRGYVEDTPLLICNFLPNGKITFANSSYCRYFNKTNDELIGSTFFSLIPEADHKAVMNNIASLTLESPTQSHEHQVITPRGDICWQHWVNRALFDAQGNTIGYQSIGNDITERKHFEEKQHESEQRFRYLSNASTEAIFFSKDGIGIEANQAAADMFGFNNPSEFVGIFGTEIIAPESHELVKKHMLNNLPSPYEAMGQRKNGNLFPISIRGKKMLYKNNETVRATSIVDITERKLAEETLKNNQNFLNSIIAQSPLATWISDEKGTIIKCNPALEKLLNITGDQLIGKYNVFKDEIAIEQGLIPKIRSVFEDGKTANFSVQWDANELGYKDSNQVHIEGTMFPIHNEKGILTNVVNHWIDITERKQAEKIKKQLEAQLQQVQKMESVGTLAGGIAHEFNNLLFIISGTVELLIMDAKQEDKGFLQEIIETTKRGANLVKQLLAFSRKSEMNLYTTNLNNEIQRTKTMLDRVLPRMINIKLDLAADLFLIKADQGQIEQVVLNLCLNAKDAMPDGGNLTIKTENSHIDKAFIEMHPGKPISLKEDKCVILTISDTGIGMDRKIKEHVFDPFFTTKEIGDGTGLGLSVIYGIVEDHGGHIACESAPGAGTTFKIYFLASPDDHENSSQGNPEDDLILKGTETILLVDDENSITNVMMTMLGRFGYKTLSANSGESALEIYSRQHKDIDLIVLDIGMPGIGGKKCLEKLIELDKDVKVIVASGYSTEGSVAEIGEKAKGFILKPFTGNKLIQLLRNVLDAQ